MIGRTVLVLVAVLGAVLGGGRAARANGRPPATSTISFRQGHERDIAAGMTFGLVLSHDGGKTWAWMCEDAIGYGGAYDPAYAYAPSGALFATTFDGLRVMRDGCTFDPTPEGGRFVSADALGPDGAFYFGAAQVADARKGLPADFHIHRSPDGLAPPTVFKPGDPADTNVWWQSIAAAPSDPRVVYVSGYRYLPNPAGRGTVRDHLVFRTDDGGARWTRLPTAGFPLMPNSLIHIAGIWRDDPKHLYARVELIDNTLTDGLYASADAGATWREIDRERNPLGAFVVRAANNGRNLHDLIAGTVAGGAKISHDDGKTWSPLAGAPHMSCLVESSTGELWACTQNYGAPPAPSDGAGIMKTTDLSTWTQVLRYQDLTDAVTCPAGTRQHDTCAPMWCAVCAQLGCTPPASYACPVRSDAPPRRRPPARRGGCCDAGAGAGGPLALALSATLVLMRPRRRTTR